MTAPAMIDLLVALRALGPVLRRARDTSPARDLRGHLDTLDAARVDMLDAIARASAPKAGTPVGDLLAARRRFATRDNRGGR